MSDTDRVLNVLFLCTGNSARSIMSECAINREGKGRFRGYSAGSHPTGSVNPYALDLMKRQNFSVEGLRSKNWEEFAQPDSPPLDFIFTVCDNAAGEVCPIWPGQPITAHWGVPDPAAVTGSDDTIKAAFFDAFRQLNNRISIFVNLPLDRLDRLAVQRRVEEIGRS